MRIVKCETAAVDLLFTKPFHHAASSRASSSSIILRCRLENGVEGYGEGLPRPYVTGESQESSLRLLTEKFAPRLLELSFSTFEETVSFLGSCRGNPPQQWHDNREPAKAAWSAIDLALLDAFGRAFEVPVRFAGSEERAVCPYSAVISSGRLVSLTRTLIKSRLFGMKSVKLKLTGKSDLMRARICRAVLGNDAAIRVDGNMGWGREEACEIVKKLQTLGINSFEQPLPPEDLHGAAQLIKETGAEVIADESIYDENSLERVTAAGACTTVNIRISKCGGLVASLQLAEAAKRAGLGVQIGCQVGESSLLSAANVIFLQNFSAVRYAEGCFGTHLLKQDLFSPMLQFGYGGTPPELPAGPGFGLTLNESVYKKTTSKRAVIG